jgi:hypothetical protein
MPMPRFRVERIVGFRLGCKCSEAEPITSARWRVRVLVPQPYSFISRSQRVTISLLGVYGADRVEVHFVSN